METIPVICVQVGGMPILMEGSVVQLPGTEPTAVGDRAIQKVADAFDRAQKAIERIAISTAQTVGHVAQDLSHPETVQVEFGLKVSLKGDVIVAGSAAEAALKVTLTYRPVNPQGTHE